MKSAQKKTFSCKLLIFLQSFLGIGAIFGGGAFMIDPSGALINMPISLLEPTPFSDFFIPGIILFFILGIIPFIIIYGLVTKRPWRIANSLNIFDTLHWSWSFSLYIGFALIIWITVQVFMINSVEFVHLVYIFLGLLIQAITLLPTVQKYYKKT